MLVRNRSVLDQHLEHLSQQIVAMSQRVLESLAQAMQALERRDVALAEEVIAEDEAINELRYQIEQEAMLVLARQQPAATDLRRVVAAIHIGVELERMGDHVSGIARLVQRLDETEELDSLHKLPKMAHHVSRMINDAIEAYLNRDPKLASKLIKRDKKVDQKYMDLFQATIEGMREDGLVQRATYLLWVGHNLERMGDRAINIAERVIFMATGRIVEVTTTLDRVEYPPVYSQSTPTSTAG